MPRKALIMPRKSAVMKRLPHFSSFCRMRMTPFSIFLPTVGTSTVPGIMPSVMTQAIVANTIGAVMSCERSVPTAAAAEAAAGVS